MFKIQIFYSFYIKFVLYAKLVIVFSFIFSFFWYEEIFLLSLANICMLIFYLHCLGQLITVEFSLQGMFVPAIKGQGTDEQQKKWLPLAYKMQIIGCYAQTELGHGSNVQGLETTATFDPKTDEFIIHSPTLTSSKVSSSIMIIDEIH